MVCSSVEKISPRNLVLMALSGLMLCIVLPNMIFWVAGLLMGFDRPLMGLDYFFSGALFACGWRKVASLLLVAFLMLDILVIQGQVYPVLHPRDVIYLVSLLPYAPLLWKIAAAGLFALVVAVVAFSWRLARSTSRIAALITLALATLIYAIQPWFDSRISEFDRKSGTLLGSQSAYYANTRIVMLLDDLFETRNPLYSIGLRKELSNWVASDHARPDKILLIVVESWGSLKSKRAQQAVIQPILDMHSRFAWIELGQAAAMETTLEAELLYLCGLGTHYLNLKPVKEGLEDCLPWRLKSLGYRTVALHGAVGKMHGRTYWYPRVGFDEIHFGDSGKWDTRCYSFPGACDREIMSEFIPGAFSDDGRNFVYWLSLNTHAPYDERDIWIDRFDCTAHLMVERGEICRLSKLHAQFFHQLAEIMKMSEMSGVEVFLVGDHVPPIMDRSEFSENLIGGVVPLIHLRIK